MKELLARPNFRLWLALVGMATLLLGAAYTMVQQSTRLAADDLPLAAAQSIKHELEAGVPPTQVVPSVKTNLRIDTTTFVIITDNSQQVLASSAELDGHVPLPPKGVFEFTKVHDSDHFTWQPVSRVRMATRVLKYSATPTTGGYIITGQSLSQAEDRVGTYGWLAAAAWLATVAWLSLLVLASPKALLNFNTRKSKK